MPLVFPTIGIYDYDGGDMWDIVRAGLMHLSKYKWFTEHIQAVQILGQAVELSECYRYVVSDE